MAPLIYDMRNLRLAFRRVASNTGRNTPGVDGINLNHILANPGRDGFLKLVEHKLREAQFHPAPLKRRWIPKPGKPGEERPLGIPTWENRMIGAAILQVIEPLFEARFSSASTGFRPGLGVPDAVSLVQSHFPGPKYVLEGDIKSCFDEISHAKLLERVRRGLKDTTVLGWIEAFLRAGVSDGGVIEAQLKGVPQGSILSPLLSNIALSCLDERYAHGKHPFQLVRYADDFVIFSKGSRSALEKEKKRVALLLNREMGLSLSNEKSRITPVKAGFGFLGYEFQWDERAKKLHLRIPQDRIDWFRGKLKAYFEELTRLPRLEFVLSELNPVLRGWGNFYLRCENAPEVFSELDREVFAAILNWLKLKYPTRTEDELFWAFHCERPGSSYPGWSENDEDCVILSDLLARRPGAEAESFWAA